MGGGRVGSECQFPTLLLTLVDSMVDSNQTPSCMQILEHFLVRILFLVYLYTQYGHNYVCKSLRLGGGGH